MKNKTRSQHFDFYIYQDGKKFVLKHVKKKKMTSRKLEATTRINP
jgi:hypothetical protein